MNKTTPTVTAKSAFQALAAAGYPRGFVSRLLPDWWDNALFKTSTGAIEFAAILKQRLGLSVSFAADGELQVAPCDRRTRYKKRASTAEADLQVCASLGLALGRLALFCGPDVVPDLPTDPLKVAKRILANTKDRAVTLPALLDYCWSQGIPVLFLKEIPRGSRRMAGMALKIGQRPVIVLGFQSNQCARQLFVLAHELAHICLSHVDAGSVVIDEGLAAITDVMEEVGDASIDDEEAQADAFALSLLRHGLEKLPNDQDRYSSPAELASRSLSLSKTINVDAGHIILSYARTHDNWLFANQALAYLPGQKDAMALIQKFFLSHCKVSRLTEENANYLLRMQGFHERDPLLAGQ